MSKIDLFEFEREQVALADRLETVTNELDEVRDELARLQDNRVELLAEIRTTVREAVRAELIAQRNRKAEFVRLWRQLTPPDRAAFLAKAEELAR